MHICSLISHWPRGYLQRPGVGFFPHRSWTKRNTNSHYNIFFSEHNLTLFLMTHGTQTIGKIAVYDMAINFIIHFIVYSVNRRQV